MKDKMLFLSDTTAAAGVGVGLANVYTILGIILIVLNIGILLINLFLRIRDRLKDGKFTNEEKAETAKEILNLTEEVKKLQEELSKYYDIFYH